MDGVVFVVSKVYEWGNGGGGGDLKLWDTLIWNVAKLRTYLPFKISDITSVGDRTVILHLPNICR